MVSGIGMNTCFQLLATTGILINPQWACAVRVTIVVFYIGGDFPYNGAWDAHIKKLIQNGNKKVNQLNNIISNRYINECTLYVATFSSSPKPGVW